MHYLVSAILVFPLMTQGVKPNEQEIFSSVPARLRTQLTNRLKLYVRSERRQDYGKLYDLFSEATKNPVYLKKIGGVSVIQSKVAYIKFRKAYYPKVLGFIPQSLK